MRRLHTRALIMIRAENVTRKFGDVTAVDGASFEVRPGEIFAFLGPNGAGKTTTIKMLTTLLAVTSGRLEIDGLDPMRHKSEVRRRFGIVFQDPSLDQDLTAWENMELQGALYGVPRKLRRERSGTLLTMFDLYDRRDRPVKEFSGGMRRRLEIARGLLHTPKILFLDEPTLGLDPQSRSQLWTHVKKLNQTDGVTVFLTTHYLDEADRAASRIAIIDHGRIVALGTSRELKEKTATHTLEDAFLSLTSPALRDETVGVAEQMRTMARMVARR
jgi:ABC-2 type transport system ATP-binding protein